MNSIDNDCNELKRRYEQCFNTWFSENFLKGDTKDDPVCLQLFENYQKCVKKALEVQKINLWEVEADVLGTEQEKKAPPPKN